MRTLLEVIKLNKSNIDKIKIGEPDFIDLGLPSGILWAKCNLGATIPEEGGDYFAWGDVNPKKDKASYDSYKYFSLKDDDYIKYNNNDGLTELEDCDNAVKVNLGKEYDMPTRADIDELLNNVKYENIIINGQDCIKCISDINEKYIIFPFAGYIGRHQNNPKRQHQTTRLWSKTLDNDNDYDDAIVIRNPMFQDNILDINSTNRILGCSIRPIKRP